MDVRVEWTEHPYPARTRPGRTYGQCVLALSCINNQ